MIQIGKTTDLLKAVPIVNQLAINRKEVFDQVGRYVTKAAMQVGTDLNTDRIELIVEDLIDCYKYDSLEDIAEALKKGRQGRYGKVYGQLNGVVIGEWMARHLEEKAIEREKLNQNAKFGNDLSEDLAQKSDKADEYIAKIKEIINRTIKNQKDKGSPVVTHENTDGGWMKVIMNDPELKSVYDHVLNKFKEGKELTDQENEWVKAWKIPVK